MTSFATQSDVFGVIRGVQVQSHTISNNKGTKFTVVDYGATLMSVCTTDASGLQEEITLNYTNLDDMIANHGPYYGAIAGRVANRIAKGTFSVDGNTYKVAMNNGQNSLHGGISGFDQKVWAFHLYVDGERDVAGVRYTYLSVDGEEGYPGNVKVTVTYELNGKNQLSITYHATTDKATPLNLTNHTYWNLSGGCKRRILDQQLHLSCSRYLPVPPDGTQIPTGELRDTATTLFDFTTPRPLRKAVLGLDGDGTGRCGLDHCFVVDGALDSSGKYVYDAAVQQTSAVGNWDESIRSSAYLRHVATLSDLVSGRQLTVHATQPAIQIYSANWLDNRAFSADQDLTEHPAFPHVMHNAVCLETEHFPDAVNQEAENHFFPTVVLRPNETYFHQAVFSFSTL